MKKYTIQMLILSLQNPDKKIEIERTLIGKLEKYKVKKYDKETFHFG